MYVELCTVQACVIHMSCLIHCTYPTNSEGDSVWLDVASLWIGHLAVVPPIMLQLGLLELQHWVSLRTDILTISKPAHAQHMYTYTCTHTHGLEKILIHVYACCTCTQCIYSVLKIWNVECIIYMYMYTAISLVWEAHRHVLYTHIQYTDQSYVMLLPLALAASQWREAGCP